jgi:hypothetical protein
MAKVKKNAARRRTGWAESCAAAAGGYWNFSPRSIVGDDGRFCVDWKIIFEKWTDGRLLIWLSNHNQICFCFDS